MAREQLKTLSEPMYYILLALTSTEYGYGIMQKVEEISSGRVKVGAGTLYALLARFTKEQIVYLVSDDGRRKSYALTPKGLEMLKHEYERLNQMVLDGTRYLESGGSNER
ncbi:MAG: PadR family transcriptional regulator [Bacillota bacterium]|nr:PadR family transcriptional regulator [Bacillota bacterium]